MYIESSTIAFNTSNEFEQDTISYSRRSSTEIKTYTHMSEAEKLLVSSSGSVQTKDGDTIDITLKSALLRYDKYMMVTSQAVGQLKDPLVINLEGGLVDVNESSTFEFDLDSDQENEDIALLSKGNGFLVYDKNENGVIDDGSELFGTQSGDGFADLSLYDEDQNGWIDENDSIFSKLQVWQKTANEDNLISLSQAQVGALLLESADTSFTYKNGSKTVAQLKESSIVLFEDGRTGWMSHVDFATNDTSQTITNSSEEQQTSTGNSINISSQSSMLKSSTVSSSSEGQSSLLSSLKSRLTALKNRLEKTHDASDRNSIMVQIIKLSMQIAQLSV